LQKNQHLFNLGFYELEHKLHRKVLVETSAGATQHEKVDVEQISVAGFKHTPPLGIVS